MKFFQALLFLAIVMIGVNATTVDDDDDQVIRDSDGNECDPNQKEGCYHGPNGNN